MGDRVDVLIAGLGAMGSAAAYHLARRGLRVAGLDRYWPPHDRGSTHGESRVIREAYFEHPAYVPFVRRAFDAWRALEDASRRPLFVRTGAIMVGTPESVVVRGAAESARLHEVPHEVLEAAALARRFPAFRPDPGMVGVLERRAGVLDPEACLDAHLAGAREAGARLETGVEVVGWEEAPEGIRVRTRGGDRTAAHLVLALGGWMQPALAGADFGLIVERQVVHWFAPGAGGRLASPARCPVSIWEHAPGAAFYTVPDLGRGFKAALHHGGETAASADAVRRAVTAGDRAPVEQLVRRHVPTVSGGIARSRTCLYTNTRDGQFVIDRHPASDRVVVVSACSGHGFKFASAVGAAVADLVTGGEADPALDLFRWTPGR